MRTNGSGNEQLMTMAVLGVAFLVATVVAGGVGELVTLVDGLVRDLVGTAAATVATLRRSL
jgi:Mg2+ and Co2+ transporter CorA